MDLTGFRLLMTDEGQSVLREAVALEPREEDFLAHFGVLNRRYPPGLVRPALETAILRLEAASKFPLAS